MSQTDEQEAKTKPQKGGFVQEFLIPILLAVVLVLFLRHFIVGTYYIPSGSMIPTLGLNNQVVVTKLSYKMHEPVRGDIVVFKYPVNEKEGLEEMDYVKRLIGLPGTRWKSRTIRFLSTASRWMSRMSPRIPICRISGP